MSYIGDPPLHTEYLLTINKVQPAVPRTVPLRNLYLALPLITLEVRKPCYRDLSLVVGGTLCGLARGHIDILDDHGVAVLRSNSDPCSLGSSATIAGQCKVVVDVSSGCLPGLATVGTDLKLGGTQTSVEDGGSKPVLRSTSVHLDLETIGDGARDKLPLDRDLAEVLVGELREHVR